MLSLSQHAQVQKAKQDSLGIKRADMPQIFQKNLEDFKVFLYDNHIPFIEHELHPSHLTPSQNEFNINKIEWMMGHTLDGQIVISGDKYVVDGHHRWITALIDGQPFVKCIEIMLPIKELLELLHTYDKVGYKSVKEHNRVK